MSSNTPEDQGQRSRPLSAALEVRPSPAASAATDHARRRVVCATVVATTEQWCDCCAYAAAAGLVFGEQQQAISPIKGMARA
jgi:hypothetical protein